LPAWVLQLFWLKKHEKKGATQHAASLLFITT